MKDKIKYDKKLEGQWQSKNGEWKIIPLKDEIRNSYLKDKKHSKVKQMEESEQDVKFSKEDIELMEKLKDTYAVYYNHFNKEATFIATPFKVGNNLFLDFTPFEFESEGMNSLAAQHLIKTHSVCLVEYEDDNTLKFKWLDEDIVKDLIKENNLKIKHEKIGIEDEFVLTASSEELYRFLGKFMSSNLDKKWEKDQTHTLNKVDARP